MGELRQQAGDFNESRGFRSIGYLAARYPLLSETFIRREVDALRAVGESVETFSIHRTPPETLLSDDEHRASTTTTSLRPVRVTQLIVKHASALFRSPRAYFGVLTSAIRYGQRDPRRMLWQLFYFAEAILLWHECKARNIRHFHAHFSGVAVDVARLATMFGNQTSQEWSWSVTIHGPGEFMDVTKLGLTQKIRDAAFVVCISDFCKSQVMALVEPEHWKKLNVVHCGIDPDRFVPRPQATADRSLKLLCVGRLVPEKGQMLLIEAVKMLRDSGTECELTLVGSGPTQQAIEDLCRRLNVEDIVHLTGPIGQDDILKQYHDADAFCLPSAAEGVPVVLMEAMSSALPVITTSIAGIPELVDDGESGIIVRPGRVDQIAKAIERLVEPEVRERMGRAGRQKVEQEFNIASSAELMKRLFESI